MRAFVRVCMCVCIDGHVQYLYTFHAVYLISPSGWMLSQFQCYYDINDTQLT